MSANYTEEQKREIELSIEAREGRKKRRLNTIKAYAEVGVGIDESDAGRMNRIVELIYEVWERDQKKEAKKCKI